MAGINPTTLARLVCDEATARRVADRLADAFEAAVAAFEGTDGRWNVEAFFAGPPDETEVRACVEQAAGPEGATLVFDRVEARDWIATSLAGLKPVDRKSTRLNSSHYQPSRMPSSA